MKKNLLFVALMVVGTVAAFAAHKPNAFRSGDNYYMEYYGTGDQVGRFYLAPGTPNLVVNGNFTAGETLMDGWESADASDSTGALVNYFMVAEGVGPDGGNALEVIASGGENTGGDIMQAVVLPAGNYIISYWLKAAEGSSRIMCNPNTFGTNMQRIFLNNDGTGLMDATANTGNGGVPVSKYLRYDDQWKEIAYQVTVAEDCYAVFRFGNLQVGDQFTNFGIYAVQPMFDDRPLTELIAKMEAFLADELDFPNGREDLQGTIDALKEALETVTDQSSLDGVLEEATTLFNEFMDANTVDISKYYTNFFFDGLTSNSSKTVWSGWTLSGDGSRWNRKAPTADIGFPTSHINQEAGAQAIQLNQDSYFQTQKMIPGARVMYTVKSYGRYQWKGTPWGETSSGSYNANYADSITNQRFFINKDTTVMEHLSTSYAKNYTMYGTVGEDSLLTIGFRSAGAAKADGGDFRFDNVELRLIGGATQEQVDYFFWGNQVALQRSVLAERLATAQEYLISEKYVYAKDSLQHAIDNAQEVQAMEDEYTEAFYKTVLAQVNALKNAWVYVEKQNAEYTALVGNIAKADEALADESRPKGKNELKTVNDAAKALKATVVPIVPFDPENESVVAIKQSLTDQNAQLVDAIAEFYLLNAAYSTPADIVYSDPDVTTGTGWTRTRTDNTSFGTQGYSYSRGNGANDAQRVYQDVAIKKAGVYVFSAIMAANNNGNRDSEETGVYLYVGNDSVQVHTTPIKEDWNPGNFAEFSVRTIVNEVPEDGLLQVGLNAEQNKVCNQIRFGYTTLKYYGEYAQYVKDSIAVVMKPTKDSLQLLINDMSHLKNESRNPNNVDVSAFGAAIETAQNVVNNSEDFDLVMAQFNALEAARQQFVLSGVYPAEGKFFDLSFVVKNPTFTFEAQVSGEGDEAVTKNAIYDWTETMAEGQTFNVSNGVVYGKNYSGMPEVDAATETETFRTKLSQQLAGLPAGAYQFGYTATYHAGRNSIYDPAEYANPNVLFVTTPQDTVAAKGLVQDWMTIEGNNQDYASDQGSTYIVFTDEVKMLLYDYRHGASASMLKTMKQVFDLGFYRTLANLDVKAGEQPVVGFYLQNMPSGDHNFFLANPTLHFYGDEANRQNADGIKAVEVAAQYAGAIYNLAGQKQSGKLQKGLYIMDGKKYVVK